MLSQRKSVPSVMKTEFPPTRIAVITPAALSASISILDGRPISTPCATDHFRVPSFCGARAARKSMARRAEVRYSNHELMVRSDERKCSDCTNHVTISHDALLPYELNANSVA